MPRARTGSAYPFIDEQGRERWKIGITLPDGSRQYQRCPPGTTKAAAKREAAALAKEVMVTGALRPRPKMHTAGERLADWFERFCKAQGESGILWVKDYRSMFRNHIGPHICDDGTRLEDKAVAAVTRRDIEGVVFALDAKISAHEIRWKTAQNVWSVVTTMFDEACASKRLDLRVREDDPTNNVKPPNRGAKRAKTFLYPDEFLALVSCELVPLHRRRLYAVALYLYGRAAEVEALEWNTVNLDRGTFRIHQAMDRLEGDKVKPTKAEEVRDLLIEPNLLPLLGVLRKEADGKGRVIARHPHRSELAGCLRHDLRLAKCTRADLYANDDMRINIRYHDLRGTAATWMAMRGDSDMDIMERVGHEDFTTTLGYIRKGRQLARAFGDVFPPLPANLLEPRFAPGIYAASAQVSRIFATPTGFDTLVNSFRVPETSSTFADLALLLPVRILEPRGARGRH